MNTIKNIKARILGKLAIAKKGALVLLTCTVGGSAFEALAFDKLMLFSGLTVGSYVVHSQAASNNDSEVRQRDGMNTNTTHLDTVTQDRINQLQ
jgi:hypothetical protein